MIIHDKCASFEKEISELKKALNEKNKVIEYYENLIKEIRKVSGGFIFSGCDSCNQTKNKIEFLTKKGKK